MSIRERAINFTMGILRQAADWQEGQHALADHNEFGPWLEETSQPIQAALVIIREAESRLGNALPY